MSPKGGKRAGAGRPKSPKSKRKERTVAFRLTESDFEDLARHADDVPVARYVQRLVEKHLKRKRPKP